VESLINIGDLPLSALMRIAILSQKLGKQPTKVIAEDLTLALERFSNQSNITLSDLQFGLLRRVIAKRTHTRGIIVRVYYRSKDNENLELFVSDIRSELEKKKLKIEFSVLKTPKTFTKEKLSGLFSYTVLFEGYKGNYQNDARLSLRDVFPNRAKKFDIIMKPLQFSLLHINLSKHARGAEYVYHFRATSHQKLDQLVETEGQRDLLSWWKSRMLLIGDLVGGFENE